MAKRASAKRKKRAPKNRYDCATCGMNRLAKFFPDYNPSTECDDYHRINTCKACLQKHVTYCINNAQTTTTADEDEALGIACPECDTVMRPVNIEIATSRTMYAKFEKLERRHKARTTEGWRWCLAPNCNAGQVHDSSSNTDKEDICTCHECGARACVPCDRPYHEGESCEAYQSRVKDRVEEEDKSLEAVNRLTKPCPNPNCKARIQTRGGCASVKCKLAEPSRWMFLTISGRYTMRHSLLVVGVNRSDTTKSDYDATESQRRETLG